MERQSRATPLSRALIWTTHLHQGLPLSRSDMLGSVLSLSSTVQATLHSPHAPDSSSSPRSQHLSHVVVVHGKDDRSMDKVKDDRWCHPAIRSVGVYSYRSS
jgi:hypothetical protein